MNEGDRGVGQVETQFVDLFGPERPLVLASGEQLDGITVAYETYGTLNEGRDNGIYLCHALTGDAHAAGWHEGDKHPGWWDNLIGPGRPIDTDKWFVVSVDTPVNLGAKDPKVITTGPATVNPANRVVSTIFMGILLQQLPN